MFSDKVFKLLESIPDQLEKDIAEFNRDQKRIRDEMDEFEREMKERRAKSRLLRK